MSKFFLIRWASCPRGYKIFSCSTQLSMKFFMLINVKMPTIVGKNTILGLSKPKKCGYFYIYELLKFYAATELSMKKILLPQGLLSGKLSCWQTGLVIIRRVEYKKVIGLNPSTHEKKLYVVFPNDHIWLIFVWKYSFHILFYGILNVSLIKSA